MDYPYDELLSDLEMGREIEFSYLGERYSISCNKNGWYLTRFGDVGNYQSFIDQFELLNNARISGKTLQEIWDNVRVEIIF